MEVSFLQGAYSGYEAAERLSECMRDKEHQSASHKNCRNTEQKQIPVEWIQELRGRIIGLQHAQSNRSGVRARQVQRRCQKALVADLDIMGSFLRRSSDKCTQVSALHLCGRRERA